MDGVNGNKPPARFSHLICDTCGTEACDIQADWASNLALAYQIHTNRAHSSQSLNLEIKSTKWEIIFPPENY